MSVGLNRCEIIGHLGRDPEMRFTPNGQQVTQFSVAVDHSWKPAGSSEWQNETEWFRCVLWGDQAERAAERLRKGSLIYVEGRLKTREWTDKSDVKRYTTELVVSRFIALDKKPEGERAPQRSASGASSDEFVDDLPF